MKEGVPPLSCIFDGCMHDKVVEGSFENVETFLLQSVVA